jgi:Tfp pilus assembly PilM family ATPase
MPEKFLGLDIGSESVKAVLLLRGLRRAGAIAAVRRIGIAEAGGLAEALEEIFSDETFRGALCLCALNSSTFSFRSLKLPFREEKKIRKTIAFAVEGLIHQSLDEVLIDYAITSPAKQTSLFAAIAEKRLIGERINLLAPYVRETVVIDVGAVPMALLISREPGFPPCGVILDIGARDSTAIFAGPGRIYHIRHFYFGAQKAADAVTDALGAENKPAEEILKEEISPEAMDALGSACESFLSELKNTALFLNDKGQIPAPPSGIFLTGGGAQMPGIVESLSKLFRVAVEKTDLLASGGFRINEALRRSWNPAIMDQALALAARPLGKGGGFNLVKREREMEGDRRELGGIMKKAAVAAGVIAVLAGIELGIDDYSMRMRLAQLKQDVVSEYKKIDPETTRIVDPIAQIRGKIAEARKLSASRANPTSPTALDILRELSAVAPPEILLNALSLEEGEVVVKGEAPDFDAMDAFKKKLEGSKYVKTVTVGATSLMKESRGVEFNVKAMLKR